MRVVILQPSYIPWRGYFHQIHKADVFVFYDDAAYDKHGWRNRNRIKQPQGSQWLTIPVLTRGSVTELRPINAVRINWNLPWNRTHWRTLQQAYGKAPHFARYRELLQPFYSRRDELLADFLIDLTVVLARELGIRHTQFVRSSSLPAEGHKTDRLLGILRHLRATHYLSGPSARDYLEEDKLRDAGIRLEYMDYDYPEYPQLHPPFDPQVSILDLLFLTGPDAPGFIWDKPAALASGTGGAGEERHPSAR